MTGRDRTSAESWIKDMAARRNEPLHPDLVPYLTDGEYFSSLRHPLVYSVPFTHPAVSNDVYSYKKEAVAKALTAGDWSTYVWLFERPHRLDAYLTIRSKIHNPAVQQDLLCQVWVDSENIWQNLSAWERLVATAHGSYWMTEGEQEHLRSLPDVVTVWRGAWLEHNEDGLSYTTDRTIAEFFAKRFGPQGAAAVVIEATVRKEDVLAYLESRGESEIVVRHAGAPVPVHYHEV